MRFTGAAVFVLLTTAAIASPSADTRRLRHEGRDISNATEAVELEARNIAHPATEAIKLESRDILDTVNGAKHLEARDPRPGPPPFPSGPYPSTWTHPPAFAPAPAYATAPYGHFPAYPTHPAYAPASSFPPPHPYGYPSTPPHPSFLPAVHSSPYAHAIYSHPGYNAPNVVPDSQSFFRMAKQQGENEQALKNGYKLRRPHLTVSPRLARRATAHSIMARDSELEWSTRSARVYRLTRPARHGSYSRPGAYKPIVVRPTFTQPSVPGFMDGATSGAKGAMIWAIPMAAMSLIPPPQSSSGGSSKRHVPLLPQSLRVRKRSVPPMPEAAVHPLEARHPTHAQPPVATAPHHAETQHLHETQHHRESHPYPPAGYVAPLETHHHTGGAVSQSREPEKTEKKYDTKMLAGAGVGGLLAGAVGMKMWTSSTPPPTPPAAAPAAAAPAAAPAAAGMPPAPDPSMYGPPPAAYPAAGPAYGGGAAPAPAGYGGGYAAPAATGYGGGYAAPAGAGYGGGYAAPAAGGFPPAGYGYQKRSVETDVDKPATRQDQDGHETNVSAEADRLHSRDLKMHKRMAKPEHLRLQARVIGYSKQFQRMVSEARAEDRAKDHMDTMSHRSDSFDENHHNPGHHASTSHAGDPHSRPPIFNYHYHVANQAPPPPANPAAHQAPPPNPVVHQATPQGNPIAQAMPYPAQGQPKSPLEARLEQELAEARAKHEMMEERMKAAEEEAEEARLATPAAPPPMSKMKMATYVGGGLALGVGGSYMWNQHKAGDKPAAGAAGAAPAAAPAAPPGYGPPAAAGGYKKRSVETKVVRLEVRALKRSTDKPF